LVKIATLNSYFKIKQNYEKKKTLLLKKITRRILIFHTTASCNFEQILDRVERQTTFHYCWRVKVALN